MVIPKLLKIFSASVLFSALQFDLFTGLKPLRANTKKVAANLNDLALYEGMSTSYVCSASNKGIDLEFKKSLYVASSTFVTVIMKKHDGMIIEGNSKKGTKIDPKVLYNNVSFRLIGRALDVCPDNVPKKSKNQFETELKRIKNNNKK
tara:strand:+ start:69 stop:512 length:444 start_codon:yes stop_codon:yes gene_type:complete